MYKLIYIVYDKRYFYRGGVASMDESEYIYIKTKYLLRNNREHFLIDVKTIAEKGNPYAIIDYYNNNLSNIYVPICSKYCDVANMAVAIRNLVEDKELLNLLTNYTDLQKRAEEISVLKCMLKKEQMENFNQIAQDLELLRQEIYLNKSYTDLKKQMLLNYKTYLSGNDFSFILYNYGLLTLCRTFVCLPNGNKLKREYKQNTNIIINDIKTKIITKQPISDYELLFYAENLLQSKKTKERNIAQKILKTLEEKYSKYDYEKQPSR